MGTPNEKLDDLRMFYIFNLAAKGTSDITLTSRVMRLKSLTPRLFVQQLIENTKTLHCRPFVRGTIRHRRIPFTKWKWCGKRFHMTSSRKYNCTGCVLIPPAHFSPSNPRVVWVYVSLVHESSPTEVNGPHTGSNPISSPWSRDSDDFLQQNSLLDPYKFQ